MTNGLPIPDERRREIFLALVQAQDGGTPVAESRVAVAQQIEVPEQQVRSIEREGLDGDWPPLSETQV